MFDFRRTISGITRIYGVAYMIRILKLISGEEVIGSVENWEEAQADPMLPFLLSEPFQFGMGQQGVVMVPFMPLAETDKLSIRRDSVVTSAAPKAEVVDNYSRITGKIVLMEKQIQTLQ